jgi:hypothetical protein
VVKRFLPRRPEGRLDTQFRIRCHCGFEARGGSEVEMEEILGVHFKRSHPGKGLGPGDVRDMVQRDE